MFRKLFSFAALTVILSLVLAACGTSSSATATPVKPTATTAATSAPTVPGSTAAPTAVPTARPTNTPLPPPTATAAPTSSGTLTVALGSIGTNMGVGSSSNKFFLDSVYEYMINANDDGKLDTSTSFVSSWTINADATDWVFKVRNHTNENLLSVNFAPELDAAAKAWATAKTADEYLAFGRKYQQLMLDNATHYSSGLVLFYTSDVAADEKIPPAWNLGKATGWQMEKMAASRSY